MKMLKIMVAALLVAAMVTPAMAEDRLSLSGEMRVRGWYDNSEFANTDLPNKTYADQRLRIGGKLAVAEGVSITFRTDITETEWGAGGSDFGAGRMASTQQWDRAHIDLTKGMFHLRAGQQYVGTGTAFAFDSQEAGLALDVAAGVPVKVFYLLDDNNDDGTTVGVAGSTGSNADAAEYGIIISPSSDTFKSSLYVVGQSNRNDADEEVYLIGANGSTDLGVVKLVGEIDVFTGDADATTDATGFQLMLDASTALDAATVGAQFFYAQGDDTDAQYTGLGNGFNGYDPIFDVGTSLSNEQMDLGDNLACDALGTCGGVFDFTGEGAGSIGGRLYASTKLGAASVGASVGYLTTEEDNVVDADGMFYAAGLVYPVLDNTSFQLQVQYQDVDVDSVYGVNVNTDGNSLQAGTGLFVSF